MLKLYRANNDKIRLKANGIFRTDAQSFKQGFSQHPFSIFRQNIATDSARCLTTTPYLKGEIQQPVLVSHNNSIVWYQSDLALQVFERQSLKEELSLRTDSRTVQCGYLGPFKLCEDVRQ